MFAVANFPEEIVGYKVVEQKHFGDTLTIKKNENDLRFVEVEFDSENCVVKVASESGNVSDMFNTCRTNFVVGYIKEFFGGLF